MELIKIKQNKKEVSVLIKVGNTELKELKGIVPRVNQLNEILFNSKKNAIEFYEGVRVHNDMVISDNTKRMSQMPDSLDRLTEFVGVIKKANALSKRNSEKIEGVINAYDNYRGFEKNIADTIEHNKTIIKILKELNKLK